MADPARAEALARRLGGLGVTWSCNAKADVPYDTLKIMKDNGLRLLLVGYESGNQAILNAVKKGIRLDIAQRFTKHAKELGIKIHGTFILGLPGETAETIQETIRFASDIDPDTVQVSIAAPYPGTELLVWAGLGVLLCYAAVGRDGMFVRRPALGSTGRPTAL